MTKKNDVADFEGVGPDKCPIAGVDQTFQSYKKDLLRWSKTASIAATKLACHVISRGFCRVPVFQEEAEMLNEAELSKTTGFQYLISELNRVFRVGPPGLSCNA